jgi:TPR repeat protein
MKQIAILITLVGSLVGSGCDYHSADSSASLYQSGLSAYDDKNYSVAFKAFTESAEQGNAKAQSYLGLMYFLGEGVPRNTSQAMAWLRKAAEQGDAEAQFALGGMYETGKGGAQGHLTGGGVVSQGRQAGRRRRTVRPWSHV